MAALSPETDAIIKRLKAEGELIRNSGTNSLRTLNVKLDKFDSLFSSINANMVEQTTLLERQLGIAKQTEAAAKNQEQFDELKRTAPMASDDSGSKRKERKPNWVDKIPDMLGNGIASAFTMKKLAIGAAGAFVGYNLLKGAIDEKTGGGFSEFESGLVSFGRGLGDIDMKAIQEDFASLKTSIAGIAASLTSLTAAIEVITSLDWKAIVTGVLTSVGMLTAYTATLRAANLLGITSALGGSKGPRNAGKNWLSRLLTRSAVVGGGAALAAGANGALTADAAVPNPKANLTDVQRAALSGSMDLTPNPRAGVMTNMADVKFNYNPLDDKYTSKSTGKVLAGTARTAAEQARLRRMPLPTLPSAVMDTSFKPPKAPLAIVPNPRAVADEFIRANRGRITIAITKAIPGVVAKSVPILGLFVGLGFMVWSISKADWTSAAAEGVSLMLPGFTGLPLDITAAATSVFNEVTGRTYLNTEADRLVMLQIADMMHAAYIEYMEDAEGKKRREYEALPEADRAAREAEAEYIAGGGRPGQRGMGNNNTGSMSLGSYNGAPDNNLNQSPGFKGSYFAGTDGFMYFQPSANSEGSLMAQRIGKISDLSASNPAGLIIDKSTHISSTPVSQHGGNHNSAVTVIGSGSPGESNRTLPGFVN
tara:strand:+ start:2088 stop:4040 length:1953 start_codon:yes stop_codon:yes gene_type:complete